MDISGRQLTTTPHVAILLATYNGAKFLRQQLESISRQTHQAWSVWVADDGSTDATMRIVEEFRARHPGSVFVLAGTPVGSAKDNFFRLLRSVPRDAAYFALCDQDDVWAEEKLTLLLGACAAAESAHDAAPVLVYSDLEVVDADLQVRAESFLREIKVTPSRLSLGSVLMENAIPGCSMLFNRSLRAAFDAYSGDLEAAVMHDWWLALLAFGLGDVVHVPVALVRYRQHGGNVLGSVRRRGVRFALAKLRQAREAFDSARDQGKLLHAAYGPMLPTEAALLVAAYSEFDEVGKFRRVWRCVRYGLLKQTWARRAYQLAMV